MSKKSFMNVVSALDGDKISVWTDYKILVDGYINVLEEKLKLEESIVEIDKRTNKNGNLVNRIFGDIEIRKELKNINNQLLDVNSLLEKYENCLKCAHCFYKLEGTKENLNYVNAKRSWNDIAIEKLEKQKNDGLITDGEEKELSRLYVFQIKYNELCKILEERYDILKREEEYENEVTTEESRQL